MKNLDSQIQKSLKEEQLLQFHTFTNKIAFDIGMALIDKAKRDNLSIVIHISRLKQTIFHFAFDGTTPDNDRWIEMKYRIVSLFGHSSHYVSLLLQKTGLSLNEAYCLDKNLYSASGGCFPILLEGHIPIGHISVSGLSPEEDHALIVTVLKNYLNKGVVT